MSKESELFEKYLSEHGYENINALSDIAFECESDGMPYVAKLSTPDGDDDKPVRLLKNEVDALTKLWKIFPSGEARTFILPPGPETIFDEEFEGVHIYGYVRFKIDGVILGQALRKGTQLAEDWIETFANITKEIDSLPNLNLQRTEEKKSENFDEMIVKNSKFWAEKLPGVIPGFENCKNSVVSKTESYFKSNHAVLGTALCSFNPDNLVFEEGPTPYQFKPYLISYRRLNQSYPRFYDIAVMYGWILGVLGDYAVARTFWEKAGSDLDIKQKEFLQIITNEAALGGIYNAYDLEKIKPVCGCEVFFL